MSINKTKILYIAGWGRSGSTILASVLGQVNGFVSVGEMSYLAQRGLIQDRLCGCGQPFSQCDMWQSVIRTAFGTATPELAVELQHFQDRACRVRHFPALWFKRRRSQMRVQFQHDLTNLSKLYCAIQSHSRAQVIIDSSKNPAYAYWLAQVPDLDVRVVLMTRDARASAYSWQRYKEQPDTDTMKYLARMGLSKSSVLWDIYLAQARQIQRFFNAFMVLRYEDFVRQPESSVRQIFAMLDEDSALPFVNHSEVELAPTHTVSGNPNRFRTGLIKLKFDNEWQQSMRWHQRAVVTSLTWPLLLHYGYLGGARDR
ncbi:MAG: sulfotransferase [Anaerolineae bacterium]|nr:sulfotransferase [Anaerolineae bacterium]MCO5194155.1 sulfotransferase [Anaerolineae bacterium]MCO5205408.1 sulfotransferase [Anaerolineae bacterium]